MTVSRREMLKLGAGATAMWMAGARVSRYAAAAEAKIPIGMQLWPVRSLCEKDLPAVLTAAAKMGYQAIELAHSYYGKDAQAWRKLLDENGLKACGMHMGLPQLEGDAFAKTVEIHKVLGTPYLIIASVPKENLASVEAIQQTVKRFNAISDKLQAEGMKLGYHCHGGDFTKMGEKTPWEIIGGSTKPEIIMQIDIGNCLQGGGDPIAMIEKFPGRSVSVHLKHYGGKPGAVIGEDTVNWKEVFGLCETIGGTKQYVVEEGGPRGGGDPMDAAARSLKSLRAMGK